MREGERKEIEVKNEGRIRAWKRRRGEWEREREKEVRALICECWRAGSGWTMCFYPWTNEGLLLFLLLPPSSFMWFPHFSPFVPSSSSATDGWVSSVRRGLCSLIMKTEQVFTSSRPSLLQLLLWHDDDFFWGGFVFWILRHRRSHNLIWMFHKSEHEQTQLWIIFLQPIREVCVLKTNCWLVLFCVFCSVILSYCFRSLLGGTRWSHVVSASINNCNLVQWFGWSCLNSLYRVS